MIAVVRFEAHEQLRCLTWSEVKSKFSGAIQVFLAVETSVGFYGIFKIVVPIATRLKLTIVGNVESGELIVRLEADLAFSYVYILAVEFAMGAFSQVWNVSTFSGLQMAVPDAMRGRVVSLVFTLVMLAPIGALFCGMLADATSDQTALGIFGIVPAILLIGILTFGHRQLRAL